MARPRTRVPTAAQIDSAARPLISQRTVSTHESYRLAKLGVDTRAAFVT
jgi:hypothetical protein